MLRGDDRVGRRRIDAELRRRLRVYALRSGGYGAGADGYDDEVRVGARKRLNVQPMVVSGVGDSRPLVVYLFGDAAEESPTGTLRWEGGQAGTSGPDGA